MTQVHQTSSTDVQIVTTTRVLREKFGLHQTIFETSRAAHLKSTPLASNWRSTAGGPQPQDQTQLHQLHGC